MNQPQFAAAPRDDLARPASVLVGHALQLKPGEKLVVFTDRGSRDLATAIADAAKTVSADAIVADLDDVGARPHKLLPDAWSFALALAQASVFVATAPAEELSMRQHLLHLVAAHRLRHAHMPGISRDVFVRGVRVRDIRSVARARRLHDVLASARTIECASAAGTSLRVELEPGTRWFAQLGVLEAGRWGNLPAGAIYASPANVDGVFAANASLGEWFGRREGSLAGKPVRFRIRGGQVVEVFALHARELEREIESVLEVAANSSRIGVVSLGVNDALEGAFGDPLVDQNLPGLHLSIGDPAARITGARWSAPTSFAACQVGATVIVDGVRVIADGKLCIE
jgi:leucyl aminopeptidase (aminopeptidase T)